MATTFRGCGRGAIVLGYLGDTAAASEFLYGYINGSTSGSVETGLVVSSVLSIIVAISTGTALILLSHVSFGERADRKIFRVIFLLLALETVGTAGVVISQIVSELIYSSAIHVSMYSWQFVECAGLVVAGIGCLFLAFASPMRARDIVDEDALADAHSTDVLMRD
jgi:hypothetical protein